MSSTTQVTTFSDLYMELLNRTRSDTTTTATIEQAKRYINTGMMDMHIGFGEKFPWAERNAVLHTHPIYSTGVVVVTKGSATILGAGTAWTTANDLGQTNVRAGGKFKVAGSLETYEVASVGAAASMTLVDSYIGETDITGLDYTYVEDEYDLASDFLRPIDLTRFTDGPNPIDLIDRSTFRRRFPGYTTGVPRYASIVDRAPSANTTPRRRVRLYHVPDKAYRIRYPYVTSNLVVSSAGTAQAQLSADADEPIVPLRYRHAIVAWGLYHWYRDKRDDPRSASAEAEYFSLISRISADDDIGSPKASIKPSQGSYRARARRRWAGSRGRFDVDGRFDRLES